MTDPVIAILATDAVPRTKPSNYPEPFATRMAGRIKHPLGDLFGLKSFGVNLTRLPPGAVSALHHQHTRQDEFIYVVEGEPTLFSGTSKKQLSVGMVAGFPAGGAAHHLENLTDHDCIILEIGDRQQGDEVRYPADDIEAILGQDGQWCFSHKDGTAY